MVYVKVSSSSSGKCQYELSETVTGMKKIWHPPYNLQLNQLDEALNHAVELFENEVKTLQNLASPSQLTYSNKLSNNVQCDAATSLFIYCESVFMPRKSITIKEHTRCTWQTFLKYRIYPRLGNMPIGEITPAHLIDFLLGCQAEGLSVTSTREYYMLLNLIFRMAYKTDVISCNPMDKVDRPKPRADEMVPVQVEAYTESEIAMIEAFLVNEPLKWRAMISLLIDTGMRVGECCALRWEDVNWQRHTITIKATLCYTPAKGVTISTPKNKKQRTVSVSDNVILLLNDLYNERAETHCDSYLFTGRHSTKPMHPQSPGHYLHKLGKKYNIEHLYPHKLRHSFASVAITNGADIASVSEVMGHYDKAVTLRMYTSANTESMQRASDIRRQAVKNAAVNNK